jgi:hypothetical protein
VGLLLPGDLSDPFTRLGADPDTVWRSIPAPIALSRLPCIRARRSRELKAFPKEAPTRPVEEPWDVLAPLILEHSVEFKPETSSEFIFDPNLLLTSPGAPAAPDLPVHVGIDMLS